MRLSTVFELLLIFLLIAFAAYGRVIDRDEVFLDRVARATKQTNLGISMMSLKEATENVNKHCVCDENICNCCRNFHIPLVKIQGPGCASMQYFKEDHLGVQLSFGNNILTSTVISGKKPKAICVPMPGGLSKFCGRIYSIERESDDHFKACLGLELQSATELEASLRVSCFRFGRDGLQLRPAEPLPVIETLSSSSDDDDDDYDIFGLDDDGPDSDEDDPTRGSQNVVPSNDSDDDDDDDDDEDPLGFEAFMDFITDDDDDKKKTTTKRPPLPFTIPLITKPVPTIPPSSITSIKEEIPVETKKPIKIQKLPNTTTSPVTTEFIESSTEESIKLDDKETNEETTSSDILPTDISIEENSINEDIEETTISDSVSEPNFEEKLVETSSTETEESTTISAVKPVEKISTTKKIVGIRTVKKPTITSTSINAITSDIKKPLNKPIKPDPIDDLDDSDEDDDYTLASEDEDETESETVHDSADVEEVYDDDDDDDESEEEEDAVLSALVSSDDKETTKDEKIQDNEASKPEEDDADYGMGLEELLARKRRMRSGRQSKVMRL